MRNGLLAAAAILATNAVAVWAQEPESFPPLLIQASSVFNPVARAVQPASQTENWQPPQPDNRTPPPLVCDDSCFEDSARAGDGYRVWGSAQLMLWSLSPGRTPALVSHGTVASGGVLGPGTTTLYGGNQNSDVQLGGRFTAGVWLDSCQTKGVEASYFFMNSSSDYFNASSTGVLARPFTNAINGHPDSQIIGFPGVVRGNVAISTSTQFQGAQLNGICNLLCCPVDCCGTDCCNRVGYRLDMIGGFQYLSLNESLGITENLTILPTAPAGLVPGSMIMATDSFQTRNSFYGSQLGVRGEWNRGRWFTNLSGQVGVGDTRQEVQINGSTVFTPPGGASVHQPGGVLALPTNIGNYSRDQFSVVPQIGLNVGRQVTNNFRVSVGYTMIYWSSVVRPGDQIDTVVNTTQLPTPTGPGPLVGPARPAFSFHDTDLWVHGINFGGEFRF